MSSKPWCWRHLQDRILFNRWTLDMLHFRDRRRVTTDRTL